MNRADPAVTLDGKHVILIDGTIGMEIDLTPLTAVTKTSFNKSASSSRKYKRFDDIFADFALNSIVISNMPKSRSSSPSVAAQRAKAK